MVNISIEIENIQANWPFLPSLDNVVVVFATKSKCDITCAKSKWQIPSSSVTDMLSNIISA